MYKRIPYNKDNFQQLLNTKYPSINIDNLINHQDNMIFGGFLRDCVSRQPEFNDVDMIGFEHSFKEVHNYLLSKNFEYYNHTEDYIQFNPYIDRVIDYSLKNRTIGIQLIYLKEEKNILKVLNNFFKTINFSCNGLVLNNRGLFEVIPDAFDHCQKKEFKINYINEYTHKNRLLKLLKNEWEEIDLDTKLIDYKELFGVD